MNVRLLMLPVFLAGALLAGCDKDDSKSPDASAAAKTADAKADANKDAADAKATAIKNAADAKAATDKASANAEAAAEKTAANTKAAAEKAAANAKAASDKAAAETVRAQASKLLTDLQTAVTDQKWTDAAAIVKQLDAVRDKLDADQKAGFDSLKKQYDANKRQL